MGFAGADRPGLRRICRPRAALLRRGNRARRPVAETLHPALCGSCPPPQPGPRGLRDASGGRKRNGLQLPARPSLIRRPGNWLSANSSSIGSGHRATTSGYHRGGRRADYHQTFDPHLECALATLPLSRTFPNIWAVSSRSKLTQLGALLEATAT